MVYRGRSGLELSKLAVTASGRTEGLEGMDEILLDDADDEEKEDAGLLASFARLGGSEKG